MSETWIKPFEDKFPPAETIIFPVEGYRVWYTDLSLMLKSLTSLTAWNPGERLEAKCTWDECVCNSGLLRQPNYHFLLNGSSLRNECGAGIYGLKTYEQGLESYNHENNKLLVCREPIENAVFGKVYLWGKLLECERGYRAQYGYPSGIYDTSENSTYLAKIYRVPLLKFKL